MIKNVKIDFISKSSDEKEWQLVLVEEGPVSSVEDFLYGLQNRLYDCLDAAIDGALAKNFPEASGAIINIRVDCYSIPKQETEEFFENFSQSVLEIPSYKADLKDSPFVSGIKFHINFE